MPRNNPKTPMETPGFGLRVGISIIVVFGWIAFFILWLLFGAESMSIYQNLAVILVSILVGIVILAASWVSWGIRYGMKYGKDWKGKSKDKYCEIKRGGGCGGAFYFLGFLGALLYFVTTAPTFWDAVLGLFKAIIWPAFLVYGAAVFLGL